MMFALEYDAFKRKMLKQEPPVLLRKVATVSAGTEDYYAFMSAFVGKDNTTLEVFPESDGNTYTFYTIITDQHRIERELEYERNNSSESAGGRPTGAGAFV